MEKRIKNKIGNIAMINASIDKYLTFIFRYTNKSRPGKNFNIEDIWVDNFKLIKGTISPWPDSFINASFEKEWSKINHQFNKINK